MGEGSNHNRGRRKGATLLRALVATFKWRLVLTGLLMVGNSAAHILQVGREAVLLALRCLQWGYRQQIMRRHSFTRTWDGDP